MKGQSEVSVSMLRVSDINEWVRIFFFLKVSAFRLFAFNKIARGSNQVVS